MTARETLIRILQGALDASDAADAILESDDLVVLGLTPGDMLSIHEYRHGKYLGQTNVTR